MGLRKQLEQALFRIEQLEKENKELKRRLAAYENPHTPSSQERFKPETKKEQDPSKPRFPGAPKGHTGAGIHLPKPDQTIEHKLHNKNLKYIGKYTRTIIDFTDKPLEVIKYIVHQYETPDGKIIESETNLPKNIYGKNLQAFVAELKKIGGVSNEKIANILRTLRPDLSICPATILNLIDGIAKNLEPEREEVKQEIQKSPYNHADETGMRIDGRNGYTWLFCNPNYTLYEFDQTRARAVAEHVLGKDYDGIVVSDGYNAYDIFKQQRCWSHILREADALPQKNPEAELQAKHLHEIYKEANIAKTKPPNKRRQIMKKLSGIIELGHVIEVLKVTHDCKKFAGTLQRAMPSLFTGVEHPEIPLHNNFCEQEIRPIVVHRKMMGCIRNEKGKRFINNLISMTETWKLQNKNVHQMLIKYAN